LLHYFDVAKPFEKVTGIIGLATGIIGFVLTFVYLVYSTYIFTNDPYENASGSTTIYKRNGDGAFAKLENGKYKCLFYKEGKPNNILAKYSDLGKKQYNYNKKYFDTNSESYKCRFSDAALSTYYNPGDCSSEYPSGLTNGNNCDYLYAEPYDEITNKYLFDKWVTTIIFSCFIIVCDIGLAIFGFLLFKSDGSGI